MTLASMTAYGHGSEDLRGLTYHCEVRTLNSRYLEVSVRLPRHLLALEVEMTNQVKTCLRRGKVDVFVHMTQDEAGSSLSSLNHRSILHYLALSQEIANLAQSLDGVPIPAPLTTAELLQLPDSLTATGKGGGSLPQEDLDPHRTALSLALKKALDGVLEARYLEGSSLKKALDILLDDLTVGRNAVLERRDHIMKTLQMTYIKRLEAALEALIARSGTGSSPVPEERLLMEVAILQDRFDIEEELTRLGTHIHEMRRLLESEDGAGRKLDFLCQEMHREVNTMSNKLVQTEVSQITLEMKQTVERIRQQVQNIE